MKTNNLKNQKSIVENSSKIEQPRLVEGEDS
jgi:hypothetical protein